MTSSEAAARLALHVGAPPDLGGLSARSQRALSLAAAVGAPVLPALAAAGAASSQQLELTRALDVATAQSRLVGRGLAVLPLVMVPALDVLVGLPLLAFYLTPIGRAVGAMGLGLLAAGSVVAAGMTRRVPARPRRDGPAPADEAADLLAGALRAGLPAGVAARAVADVLPDEASALREGALALEHGRPVREGTPVSEALDLLDLAERLGAPAAEELRSLATEQRAREQARVRGRAERLAAQLTVPSVLLLLPATVLLVGAPIVAAGLAAA